jgi:hypothetical protein
MRCRGPVWVVACALTLAGCSSGGTGSRAGASPSSPVASAVPSTSAPSPSPTPPPSSPAPGGPSTGPATGSGILVEFGRQGGFTGLSDRLVVSRDGSFTLTRTRPPVSRSGQPTASELAELRAQLDRADLGHQPRVQASARGGDQYEYRLVAGDAQIVAQALDPASTTSSSMDG